MPFPLSTTQGDCADWQFQYFYNGAPVNLTGYTAEFKISWGTYISPLNGMTIITPGSANATVTKENATGIIKVHYTQTQTATIPVSGAPNALTNATYQLRLTAPDGCVVTLDFGGVQVLRSYF